ncbi:MAG: class I SAM-dependent methyltransferase [Phycisphaerales bacterium]|nr:class I SAM-dependent methyltransferase [Phycisphaerales bacterium]
MCADSVGVSDTACIACGAVHWRVRHRIREYTIAQCMCCGLARTCGADFDFTEFYGEDYFVGAVGEKGYNDYFALAGALTRTNRSRVRRLKRMLPTATSLLDVGCGPGFFLEQAKQGGLRTQGLEVSPFAAHYGREQLGLAIDCGAVDPQQLARFTEPFDLVTMWDVIEHLPEPQTAIAQLAGKLSPGGVLALSTGDVASLAARLCGRRWHLYNLPEHLWFFNERSLRLLLERAGLVVERVRREACWYTARYLLDRLMYSLGRPPLKLARMGLFERLNFPVTLGDIVTIHARKPARVAVPACPAPVSAGITNYELQVTN